MKNFFYSFLLLVVLCTGCVHAAADLCEASTVGTNFIIGIMGWIRQLSSNTLIHLHVTTTGYTPAHFRVTAPFINFDSSYTVSNYSVIPLNSNLFQFEAGKQFKGVEVNSDVNISLTVVTVDGDIMEGFLALPVSALGTRYIAASYYPISSGNYSEILVAGIENNTDVILRTMINGHTGSNRAFRLQKFETYQFKSPNDFSGSIITSNKPVAVFSGSAAAKIPTGTGDYQYLAENLIPTKYWASTFIIPPIYPREHFVLKFFADRNNTELHHYNSTKHVVKYIDKGSVEEVLFGTDPVVIVANKPISVMQYGHDGDNMYGDPFMLTAQGVSNFHDSYQFATQDLYSSASNTIAITVRKTDTSELRLNRHPMSFWNAKNVSVAHPMEEYVTLFVNVSYNSYYRLHQNRGMKFGAVLYGRYATVAYGYPLKMSFTDPGHCISTGKTTPQSTTTLAPTTYPTGSLNETEKDQMCYSCEDLTHVDLCDTVKQCGKQEVCFVERFTDSGQIKYKTGCLHKNVCEMKRNESSYSDALCFECCNGDYCNNKGCGENGIPDRDRRGPICFDCQHVSSPGECMKIAPCESYQVCRIEEYKWFDHSHFKVGCGHGLCDPANKIASHVFKRATPVCHSCCTNDYCNRNCTTDSQGQSGSIIVG